MDFLNQLMGGGGRQQEYRDFAEHYDQGPPYERISDGEAADRYEEVAPTSLRRTTGSRPARLSGG